MKILLDKLNVYYVSQSAKNRNYSRYFKQKRIYQYFAKTSTVWCAIISEKYKVLLNYIKTPYWILSELVTLAFIVLKFFSPILRDLGYVCCF